MEGLCLLLASPHEHNKTLLQAGEASDQTNGEITASNEMPTCYDRAIMQVKRITLKDVRSLRIGQSTINSVQVGK